MEGCGRAGRGAACGAGRTRWVRPRGVWGEKRRAGKDGELKWGSNPEKLRRTPNNRKDNIRRKSSVQRTISYGEKERTTYVI